MDLLVGFGLGMSYFIVGIILFVTNFFAFKNFSSLNINRHILEDQNKALASIIKGQVIGQSIMIGSLIYFLGTSIDKVYIDGFLNTDLIIQNLISVISFGLLGIIVFQTTLFVLSKIIPFKKEIIIDQNESLGLIVEGLLISISVILSLSLYAY